MFLVMMCYWIGFKWFLDTYRRAFAKPLFDLNQLFRYLCLRRGYDASMLGVVGFKHFEP